MLDISVLGPLTARLGDRTVAVPGATQRAVLALLVVHRREPIPSDQLVDELWGDRMPQNPKNALQQSIRKIRTALSDTPGEVILTAGRGYQLDPTAFTVDADRFTDLVQRAGVDVRAGSLTSAQRDFREALALWRGSPLPELAEVPAARADIERLEELRLAALEGRLDADLELEPPDAVVVELRALVEAHPLRERLWRQLMVALYRAGRQGDALAAYQTARTVLLDEIGVEPSEDLRRIQGLVLAQDPLLNRAPVSSASSTPAALRDLIVAVREAAASMGAAGLEAEHVNLLLSLARSLNSQPMAYDHRLWLEEFDATREQYDGAIDWAVAHGHDELALDLTVELARYWDHRRLLETAVSQLEKALASGRGPAPTRSEALTWLGFFLAECGRRDEALARLRESRELAQGVEDQVRLAGAKAVTSVVLRDVEPTAARLHAAEAVRLFTEHGSRRQTAYGWTTHALSALADGHVSEAEASARAALALYAEMGDRRGLAWTKSTQAEIALRQGDTRAADALRADARAVALDVEDSRAAGLLS